MLNLPLSFCLSVVWLAGWLYLLLCIPGCSLKVQRVVASWDKEWVWPSVGETRWRRGATGRVGVAWQQRWWSIYVVFIVDNRKDKGRSWESGEQQDCCCYANTCSWTARQCTVYQVSLVLFNGLQCNPFLLFVMPISLQALTLRNSCGHCGCCPVRLFLQTLVLFYSIF